MALPTRRSYSGAADACTLTSAISAGDTSATLTGTVTNWPSTGTGPFYMVIDPGLAAEEKVLVTTQSSGSISVMSRGQDGTTAAAHAVGASAYPVGAAVDFDEANSALSKMTTKGDLLVTTGSAYARLPVGTNTYSLLADSTAANGVAWGQIAAGGIATGAVTSAKILDDTIMDIDINSVAAIAQSKIATLVTDLAAKAPLASPTFTGTPTLPTGTIATTQTAANSTTAVATTAFVTTADNLKANLASPTFTGTPTLPTGTIATTQTASNNTTAVATTAYVDTADALKANLASPTFTGTPTLPTGTIGTTQTAADSSTKLATTAFVTTADNLKANLASPTFTGTVTATTFSGALTGNVTGNVTGSSGSTTGNAATATAVVGMAKGSTVITVTSNQGVIPHGLGSTPSTAIVCSGDSSVYGADISVTTSTTNGTDIGVYVAGVAGPTSIRVNWIAFA